MFFQRKLRAKYIGDDDHIPKDIKAGKFIPVVGFKSVRKIKSFDGVEKEQDDIYLIMINDKGLLFQAAAFNFSCVIDEQDTELKLSETLRNATILLKSLSDRMAACDKTNG